MQTDAEKLASIRELIAELGDPDFWTMEMLDTTINQIDAIVDPEEYAP